MIKKIILRNFQIHKKFIFVPDKHFNVIKGRNDYGKSSIIRAIFWTAYNSPSGDWMRREKNGKLYTASVKIIFEDGTIIKRTKGEDINRYELNGNSFDNFGFQVPEPIQKALKINRLKIGNNQLYPHIAMQDDPLFLVYESGPFKASVINMLTGAEIIDKAVKDFNKDKLAASREIKTNENDIDQFRIDIKELDYIKDLDEKVKNVKKNDKKLQKMVEKLEFLQEIKQRFKRFEKAKSIKIPNLKRVIEISDKISNLKDKSSVLYDIELNIERLESCVKTMGENIIRLKKQLGSIKVCSECGRPL